MEGYIIAFCIILAILGYIFSVRSMIIAAREIRHRAEREAKFLGKIREIEEAGKNRDQ